jgi:hypothetical protein
LLLFWRLPQNALVRNRPISSFEFHLIGVHWLRVRIMVAC